MSGRLCITVMEGGWLQIGDAIVRIDEVRGSRVDVVVEAPKNIKVLRDKVIERERAKNATMSKVRTQDE
jgi:sRNA-binding carbon storage regulator CsrA